MAAPDVANIATSSDEFQKLNELVSRSDELIAEAEAWARGTKNNMDIGISNYVEDINVTMQNFAAKKAHLYIKVDEIYVPVAVGASFNPHETYYGLSAGEDNNAKYYSEQAQVAKESIEDLTVSSTTLETGSSASVTKTVNPDTGIVNLAFGLPAGVQGIRGPTGVWVGNTEPPTTEEVNVWINPEGTSEPVLLTAEQMTYDGQVEYTEGCIGAAVKNLQANIGAATEAAEQAAEDAAEAKEAANQVTVISDRVSTLETDIVKKIENPELIEGQEFGILTASKNEDTINIKWQEKLDYEEDLINLPYLNEVELKGNLTLSSLGIAPAAPSGKDYYILPDDGIPKNSLDSSVRTSLGIADDAATQIIVNGNTYHTEENVINLGNFLTDNNTINKNYLDNPWFTINQRGTTSYSSTSPAKMGVYIYDRWKIISNETEDRVLTANKNSLYIGRTSHQDPSDSIVIGQLIDDNTWNALSGKQVTASVNYSFDGTIFKTVSWSFNCPIYNGAISSYDLNRKQFDESVGWGAQVLIQEFNSKKYLVFKIFWQGNAWTPAVGDSTIYITKTKLELGGFSTLDQEAMPLYDEELKKCQRYLIYYGGFAYEENAKPIVLGSGIAVSSGAAGQIDWVINISKDMVKNPIIKSSVNLSARRGFEAAVASIGVLASGDLADSTIIKGINGIYMETKASNLSVSAPYFVTLPATASASDAVIAYFSLSAEP